MIAPKGKLIIIGGSVDKGSYFKETENQPTNLKFFEKGILRRITPKKKVFITLYFLIWKKM